MEQFIGVNAYQHDSVDRLAQIAGTVRERRISQGDDNDSSIADKFYADLHRQKVTVVPVNVGITPGLTPRAGTDPQKPDSYRDHAARLFQFAAKYGSKRQPDELLNVGVGQPKVSGLGTVRYIENWIEPNQLEPEEFAALCSADYDGHGNTMGPMAGVKNADPNFKLVMGGLANTDISYLDRMLEWSRLNRGGSLPFDVINVRLLDIELGGSPEAKNFYEQLKKLTDWRDKNAPQCQVWLSDFGWNLSYGAADSAPIIGQRTAKWVHAAWTARAYLLAAAAGIDRAMLYSVPEVDVSGNPSLSFTAIQSLRHELQGLRPTGDLIQLTPNVVALKFSGYIRNVLVAWAVTSADMTFRIKVGKLGIFYSSADLLGETSDTPDVDNYTKFQRGTLFKQTEKEVDVGEMPVILQYTSR